MLHFNRSRCTSKWTRISPYYRSQSIENLLDYFNKWIESTRPYEAESVHYEDYAVIMVSLWENINDQLAAENSRDGGFPDKINTPGKLQGYVDSRELDIRIRRKAITLQKATEIIHEIGVFATRKGDANLDHYAFFICLPTAQ